MAGQRTDPAKKGGEDLWLMGFALFFAFLGWRLVQTRLLPWLESLPARIAHDPVLLVPLLGLIGVGAGVAVREGRRWQHRRHVVHPLYAALASPLGLEPSGSMYKWIKVPVGFRDSDAARARIRVPVNWAGSDEQRKLIHGIVCRKLGGDLDVRWHLSGAKPYGEWTHAPRPPQKVTFAMVREAMEAGPEGRPVLGLGCRGELVRHDFDADAPHVAMNIGTGGGKSATLRALIAYEVCHGAGHVDVLDPKEVSLQEFEDVPGVTIHVGIERQWAVIEAFFAEMQRRQAVRRADRTATFSRRILVLEEGNDFAKESRLHWKTLKKKGDPADPPIFDTLGRILIKGRQFNMNVVSVYQQMNARAAGGSENRDQYGCKILARFSPQAWNFLVGTYPRPRSSTHQGRAIVLLGDEQRQVQMTLMTPDEARDFALARTGPAGVSVLDLGETMSVCPAPSTPHTRDDADGGNGRTDIRPRLRLVTIDAVDTPEEPAESAAGPAMVRGLAGAAALLGMEKAAFEKARQRAIAAGKPIPGETRDARGALAWAVEALEDWHAARPRAGQKAAAVEVTVDKNG